MFHSHSFHENEIFAQYCHWMKKKNIVERYVGMFDGCFSDYVILPVDQTEKCTGPYDIRPWKGEKKNWFLHHNRTI